MKGRVVILKEYLTPMEIIEYEVPDPEPGAMLVQIRQAGLCGSDLHTWRGDQINRPLPPTGRPMGHEGTGVIHSLGRGVKKDFLGNSLVEGDRVVFSAIYSCGRCTYCLSGNHNHCSEMRLSYRAAGGEHPYFVNTYADYIYLPPQHPVFKVPDELTDDEVVALNCAMGTVLQGLMLAGSAQGKTVVIQGAGGLGLYATAFAKDMGAECVIAVDGQQARLELARELGADETIDINQLDAPEARIAQVKALTRNRGADIVIELVGLGELMPEGIDMLGAGGTFVEIGNLMHGRTATIEPSALLRSKRVVGSIMYRPALIPSMLDFLVRNHRALPLHKVISHKFPLAEINSAFQQAEWSGRDTSVIRGAIVP